jgi:hypothetical protein
MEIKSAPGTRRAVELVVLAALVLAATLAMSVLSADVLAYRGPANIAWMLAVPILAAWIDFRHTDTALPALAAAIAGTIAGLLAGAVLVGG